MHLPMFKAYGGSLLYIFALATLLVSTNAVTAQPGPGTGAGENPWADMSRTPFEL